jgi:hypothetical protein
MANPRVVLVHLRRPRSSSDPRSDPFWEFGSFGLTGCHSKNLMHPKNAARLDGVRLAFAQGGSSGMKLVYLTERVRIVQYARGKRQRLEATWRPIERPFKYETAPLLIANSGLTQFPRMKEFIRNGARKSWVARFSSKFRSRGLPLKQTLALEVVSVYTACTSGPARSPKSCQSGIRRNPASHSSGARSLGNVAPI